MERASERDTAGEVSRVHLLLSPGRNRTLLVEWLGELPQYEVTASDPQPPVPAEYDLLLADEAALDVCEDDLRQNRRAVDPVYLPHLLVTRTDAATATNDTERELIDDVVEIPVDQADLQRRIENLLRARRASLRLAQIREQYEQLVELTPETILLVRDGAVVYGNAAAADLFGAASREALVGRATSDLVTDAEVLADVIDTVEADGRLNEFREVTLQALDGEEIPTEVAGVTVTYDDDPATQLVVRDLSEKRERQQRLDLLGRAIEASAQGVTIADARREGEPLIYANAAFERITGYDTDEVLGRNCRFLQGERTDSEATTKVREAIDDRKPVSVELLNYRKNGTPFWNRLEVVPVRNREGEVTHFLGLQQDVTERRTQQERLSVLDRVLRHNIRNRMNVVSGTADLLLERLPDTSDDETDGTDERSKTDARDWRNGAGEAPEANKFAVEASAIEDGLERIIDATEELTRISDQVREFQTVVGDPGETVERQDLTAILHSLAETALKIDEDAVFELSVEEDLVVDAHPKLGAALSVGLELVNGEPGTPMDIHVEATGDDSVVHLDVTDRAGTIPQADLEAVAAEEETAIEHSRGLELWIVRWTVLSSGGEIDVTFGEQPTVRITLQRATPEAEES